MASFGIGRALLSGPKLTGNIFQKVKQSFLQSGYGDWIAQSIFVLAFCSLPMKPKYRFVSSFFLFIGAFFILSLPMAMSGFMLMMLIKYPGVHPVFTLAVWVNKFHCFFDYLWKTAPSMGCR